MVDKLSIDLGKLHLPGPPRADWVVDPTVRSDAEAQAIRDLRDAGLSDEVIGALRRRLALEYSVHRHEATKPTVGEDRRVLEAAADLTDALALILRNASTTAKAEITAALWKASRRYRRDEAHDLQVFADELRQRAEQMPQQTRNRPNIGIVWALDEVAGSILPAPTTQHGRYLQACRAAFVLAGRPSSPDRAIRAYIKLKTARRQGPVIDDQSSG